MSKWVEYCKWSIWLVIECEFLVRDKNKNRTRSITTQTSWHIVTFHLSLRVSETLPLLCSSTPLFPTPPRLPKIFPCFSGIRWMAFGLRRAKMLGWLSVQLVSVQLVCKISNLMWSWSSDPPTLQTDRQTDKRTDDMQSQYRALHYSASRGKNEKNDNTHWKYNVLAGQIISNLQASELSIPYSLYSVYL